VNGKCFLASYVATLALSTALYTATVAGSDVLYIGDGADNTVKHFDADTGDYLGVFVKKGNSPLKGPMGLVFAPTTGDLLLSNQNSGTNKSGELLAFDGGTGDYLGALIFHNDPDAPFAPRGIIISGDTIFAASTSSFGPGKTNPPGNLLAYGTDGALLADLTPDPGNFPWEFHPRGVVMGPDGLLYVSVTDDLEPKSDSFNPVPGWILRFDPSTGSFVDVFASYENHSDCSKDLHRPEGLVFGSDGRLYVTAFRADATDNDKILIFDVAGACVGNIDLDQVGEAPRTYAQAILFGPDGNLFVPINTTGEVRRYDVTDSAFPYTTFVAPGGPLGSPWYLTFGATDPGTLDYRQ
jgi:DNA-binding beta-propeller fold protein YncE